MTASILHPAPSRRDFLKAGGATGAALVVSFALPLGTPRVLAATAQGAFAPNAFLRITPDNRVTVVCGSSEMGQGVLTAIPMLVAEELDADWKLVRVEQAPSDTAFNNPVFGMQATGGSTTIRAFYTPMRQAGAAAREMLVAAAAQQWGVPAASLKTSASHVIGPKGKRLSYGQLVEAAAKEPVPKDPTLKKNADFKIIGQRTRRLDTPGKLNGSTLFGIDAQVPGMLVAVMARAPVHGAKPLKFDEAAARAVKGVQAVIAIPGGVAVLAGGYYAARQGRDALKVQWDLGAHADLSSAKIKQALNAAADAAGAVAKTSGDTDAALSAAATRLSATYEVPYLAHATMEPLNCLAWVKDGGVEIWAGTQSQGPAAGIIANVAGVPVANVKVNTMMLGGGFGRRFAPDFMIDATLLSKISGKPVKLIYTREDDMAAGFYRPASLVKFEGGLDAKGQPTALKARVASPSIMAGSGFMKIPDNGVDSFAVEGLADQPYGIANQHVAYGRAEPGPQVWFWRSVGHSQNAFFIESFIDEMAAAAKADPYQFRAKLLKDQPRELGVLKAAAQKAGWGKPLPKGRYRGIAVAESFGSFVAQVAEVSVAKDGTPRVHRVVAAVDCGLTVNPLTIERQVESAIVYGLSAALYGQISYKDGVVEQGNFHNYPVLRISEMPKVEVHILPSQEAPGGMGEPGTPPIAPAVCNAIFAATGVRVRSLPIDTRALTKA
ncbi:xanthine dehydrogenase family protein molybdopterin-binding subunit [Bradyrhizobium sp.]|uniref:xanthine dehydrogenase family protein molybdopterin-binding subunit n=1 Tax=Bradyrhizobium sp. TaxID=376 RepID=UPI00273302B8|nr:xanthine dehydrogenase family protein molybdopterin-binding subunit [Bradyrhizobium sp.]MDP3690598.1 xanthine dehydrogenase family protein molybdopterin-binding subunit [Bradyrhizobium sp.]